MPASLGLDTLFFVNISPQILVDLRIDIRFNITRYSMVENVNGFFIDAFVAFFLPAFIILEIYQIRQKKGGSALFQGFGLCQVITTDSHFFDEVGINGFLVNYYRL